MADRRKQPGRAVELTVEALGARGDGIAKIEGDSVFIPHTAPGDRVRVSLAPKNRVSSIERLADGPDRVDPPCPHFEICGGCSVQHIAEAAYVSWKENILREALLRRQIDPAPIRPMARGAPGRRRRARLHFIATATGVVLGFREGRSHRIVAIDSCALLTGRLTGFLEALRGALRSCLKAGARGEATLTDTETGIDLTLALKDEPDLRLREALSEIAQTHDLARISWKPLSRTGGEEAGPVIARRAPTMRIGDITVALPPDGFVQPTAAGEAALRDVVMTAASGAGRVLDLYSGCGAFGLPVAETGALVHAVERDPAQIGALNHAARQAGFGERVTGEARDLDRRPLLPHELAAFDAVILDPPRAGAEKQVEQLVLSEIPLIAYVSCNPVSFARDAQMLIGVGYAIETILPVDQFLWSPHLELAGVFRKG